MTRGHRTYRRYPPLSLRPDFSKSTSSLPMRSSSAPYCGSGVDSPGASGDIVQSPYTSTYRQFVAGDQSARSASLTSIVEMYQGKSPSGLKQPIRSPCSFYYDYTEEFERGIAGKVGHGPVAHPPQGTSLDLFRDHAMKDASIETDYQGKDRKNHERLTDTDWYVDENAISFSRKNSKIKSASRKSYTNLSISSVHRQLIGELNGSTDTQQISIPAKRRYTSSTPPVQTQSSMNQLESSNF